MSVERKKRLAKLVMLQHKLKALHEAKHAGHLAAANTAEAEAREIAERSDDPASLASLFPEVYHNRIAAAFARRDGHLANAAEEARTLAAINLRTGKVEDAHREATRKVDEDAAAKERLENVERKLVVRR